MKRPTWVTIVGILGVIFSSFGLLGAVQEMVMPKMMEVQQKMFTHMQEEIRREIERERARLQQNEGETQAHEVDISEEFPLEIPEFFKRIWDPPEWYGIWAVLSGIVKLFVSGFFLFASIGLLQVKLSAIRNFYWAAGLSIPLALIKGLVAYIGIGSFLGIFLLAGALFGIAVDSALLVVVAASDKKAFLRKLPPPLPDSL